MDTVLVGFSGMLILVFLGVPVAFSMALAGFGGIVYLAGLNAAASQVGIIAVDTVMSYTFSVAALFILMGNFVAQAKLSEELYAAAYTFVGHRKGGLAMATILACGGFSTVSGSSIATAATMAPIAFPEMRRRKYSDGLSTGSIAAGGTLGILIPPSIPMVIYGNITETDVGKLFAAGIIPGLLGIVLYIAAIAAVTAVNPAAGPPGEWTSWRERFQSLQKVWGIVVLFTLVMGGVFIGVFTPTEAAGVGAGGALLIAVLRRTSSLLNLIEVTFRTGETTAALLILVTGATLFSSFATLAGLPDQMAKFVETLQVPSIVIIFVIVAMYVVLGCVFDAFAMILLTVPVLAPIVSALGYDLIWFGIIVVVVVEIAVITPPIGINVFVLKSILTGVSDATIFRGVVPFIIVDIARVAILVFFPGISLFLPSFMR